MMGRGADRFKAGRARGARGDGRRAPAAACFCAARRKKCRRRSTRVTALTPKCRPRDRRAARLARRGRSVARSGGALPSSSRGHPPDRPSLCRPDPPRGGVGDKRSGPVDRSKQAPRMPGGALARPSRPQSNGAPRPPGRLGRAISLPKRGQPGGDDGARVCRDRAPDRRRARAALRRPGGRRAVLCQSRHPRGPAPAFFPARRSRTGRGRNIGAIALAIAPGPGASTGRHPPDPRPPPGIAQARPTPRTPSAGPGGAPTDPRIPT